jgi:hypothetical protein
METTRWQYREIHEEDGPENFGYALMDACTQIELGGGDVYQVALQFVVAPDGALKRHAMILARYAEPP